MANEEYFIVSTHSKDIVRNKFFLLIYATLYNKFNISNFSF